MTEEGNGGVAVARALEALGVDNLFALTGGHIFPILDGCHRAGIRIVDTRHEQSAAFAAEGWARLTRAVGVAAVTAGPGVTNAMSALAQARFNGAPMLVLAGRAPHFRWGQGSLQEIDHVPFVDPVAPARTIAETAAIPGAIVAAAAAALAPPRGPRFIDFPLDVLFDVAAFEVPQPQTPGGSHDLGDVGAAGTVLQGAQRPIVIAGSNVWLDRAEAALRMVVERAGVPCYANGQGRGCLPADHPLAFARSRSLALREADVVVVAGAPLDFRLGFGHGFAPGATLVHLDHRPATHAPVAHSSDGPLDATLAALAEAVQRPARAGAWIDALRAEERRRDEQAGAERASGARPIHPMRVYGELVALLDRDAVVVCDGGDFASYAGRELPSYEGGCWLDPGPFGCLGVGPGYAAAARLAHPDRQVVVVAGDGALGFSAADLETLVRLKLPAAFVVGNNGIWGLEKHPMRNLYGYAVAADLQPGTRYDLMMEAFGGRGETVDDPDDLAPALKRALGAAEPYLVNVVTDPAVAYPRSANLA